MLWVLLRVSGTVLLVPFIEEMFFRGYLLQRLDFGGVAGKITALAVSSAWFGALHSDFLLAAASGLLFGLLALRRNKVFDAVVAHIAANGAIAAWAVSSGNWSII
jgi:exosortase E/protease (VPEID-CTERM system)